MPYSPRMPASLVTCWSLQSCCVQSSRGFCVVALTTMLTSWPVAAVINMDNICRRNPVTDLFIAGDVLKLNYISLCALTGPSLLVASYSWSKNVPFSGITLDFGTVVNYKNIKTLLIRIQIVHWKSNLLRHLHRYFVSR